MNKTSSDVNTVERKKINLHRFYNEGVFSIDYDGEVAGSAKVEIDDSHIRCIKVESFNIRKEFRNIGLGTDLLQYIIEIAKLSNFDSIYLCSSPESMSFFRRFGFTSIESDDGNSNKMVLVLKKYSNDTEKALLNTTNDAA